MRQLTEHIIDLYPAVLPLTAHVQPVDTGT